jgi:hypothetical protein
MIHAVLPPSSAKLYPALPSSTLRCRAPSSLPVQPEPEDFDQLARNENPAFVGHR